VCVCFSQSGTVVTMLGGHRVRVANTGNCIANRGESLLSASSGDFSLSPADCTYWCESCGKQQRIAHFYIMLALVLPAHFSQTHTRPTASADATWFVFQSNKERHHISPEQSENRIESEVSWVLIQHVEDCVAYSAYAYISISPQKTFISIECNLCLF
jgi:hypothetical protein